MSYNVKPILKWAGGKTQLLPEIIANLPDDYKLLRRYVEPFVGAGSVFFYFINNNCFEEYIINDINEKLMNLYKVIRDDCEGLISELYRLQEEYIMLEDLVKKEKFYYECREQFNLNQVSDTKMSALLIFLNKTCFNGLYRENSQGLFNVPFGKRNSPQIFEEKNIKEISRLLNIKNKEGKYRVHILNKSFEDLDDYIDNNTFVYFDPPYRPVTFGGFNSYNKSSFNDESQIKLRDFFVTQDKKGARLMLSNSDPKVLDKNDNFFDDLYKDFTIKRVTANRMINSKGSGRGPINELLIMNYDWGGSRRAWSMKKIRKLLII